MVYETIEEILSVLYRLGIAIYVYHMVCIFTYQEKWTSSEVVGSDAECLTAKKRLEVQIQRIIY